METSPESTPVKRLLYNAVMFQLPVFWNVLAPWTISEGEVFLTQYPTGRVMFREMRRDSGTLKGYRWYSIRASISQPTRLVI